MKEDLYEILEISRDASVNDIKKAYRKLVKEYHPDTHPGDKEIEEKFKKINNAYEILNDPEKRAQYDQYGNIDMNSINNDFDFFSDMFSSDIIFNNRRNTKNMPRNGNNTQMTISITLRESMIGINNKEIEINRIVNCEHCNGTGAKSGSKPENCPYCNGTGQHKQVQRGPFGQMVSISTCSYCHGTGEFIREKCDECHGTGRINKKEKIEVKIPAGINNNMHLRVFGKGEEGINGGSSGDLYLIINVQNHDKFTRIDNDLHMNLFINYPQAVLGDNIEIENLDNTKEKLNIPKSVQCNEILKIKGKGMPKINSNIRGDLCIHILIEVPKQLIDEELELIRQLYSIMN